MSAAMFYNFVFLLIAFCSTVMCDVTNSLLKNYHRKHSVEPVVSLHTATPLAQHDFRSNLQWHHFSNDDLSKREHIRSRRGIVLVDEDFDVPPEPGVKQGWSDGSSSKKETEVETDKVELTDEGSGILTEEAEYSTTKYIDNTSPDKLERSTSRVQLTSSVDATDIEGSGGDISEHTSLSTRIPTEPSSTPIPTVCLNFTCDSQVIILPGYSGKVPVGTNLSLTCVEVNSTEPGILQWYKYNESDNLRIPARLQEKGLTLNIPKSQMQHSGTYMCIHTSGESCCYRQLDIMIYEVPNYKTHLIIIAVVAAVSLFTCLLLAIYRNFRVKKYEVHLELQNIESPFMYKT